MILVTLGTNDKSFVRLIKKVEELVVKGRIKEDVIVQAGFTEYESEHLKVLDLIPMEQLNELIYDCSLLITHGGVGSIIAGLKANKKVIAIPRQEQYGEHVNNHQFQIIENFAEAGYILAAYDVEDLEKVLMEAKYFEAKMYTSNTNRMLCLVKRYIDE